MAEGDFGEVFQTLNNTLGHLGQAIGTQGLAHQTLATQIEQLSSSFGTQGCAQLIPPFEGDSKKFKDWIKNIEKYALLTQAAQDKIKLFAYQSSRGAVSDYLKRYLTDHDDATWAVVKAELTQRFAEITDPQHAFMLLRNFRQKQSENVQIYAERLLSLVEEAFAGQPRGVPAIERQIVGFFIDGLLHDYLKMKVMRENPETLEAAVACAMREQNLRTRFDLRTNKVSKAPRETFNYEEHSPMDIDHCRPTKQCYKCRRPGHWAKDCRTFKSFKKTVNAVDEHGNKQSGIVCWYCNNKGHIQRYCPFKTGQKQGN